MNLVLLEGAVSIVGNTVLFALKLWAGMVTGSIALTADAWHTLSDSFSSAIVIFSGWVSSRPADERHPFGHGRMDLVCSVIIGTLLSVVGLEFIIKAVVQLQGGEAVVFGRLAMVVTVISIVSKELLAQFAFWGYRRSKNPILRADGWHHRTDSFSSILVLAGIFASTYFWWIDGVLGVVVALMIFYASYQILTDAVTRLIGEAPDPELLRDISRIVNGQVRDGAPHHFHLHRYGDHTELTFHLYLEPTLSLEQAHHHAHAIEGQLREKLNLEATIHLDPKSEHETN